MLSVQQRHKEKLMSLQFMAFVYIKYVGASNNLKFACSYSCWTIFMIRRWKCMWSAEIGKHIIKSGGIILPHYARSSCNLICNCILHRKSPADAAMQPLENWLDAWLIVASNNRIFSAFSIV